MLKFLHDCIPHLMTVDMVIIEDEWHQLVPWCEWGEEDRLKVPDIFHIKGITTVRCVRWMCWDYLFDYGVTQITAMREYKHK